MAFFQTAPLQTEAITSLSALQSQMFWLPAIFLQSIAKRRTPYENTIENRLLSRGQITDCTLCQHSTRTFFITAARLLQVRKKYTVKQDGTGDFASISEAVATVPSNSTLILSEGVYNEQVMIADKTVHLEGTDRENCILQYNGNNYFEPPLSVAAGKISNLTIYSYADKIDNWIDCPPAIVDPNIPQTRYKEYAVHIEQNYLLGKELVFDNCLFLSDKNQCIGLGLRGESSVSFQNCEFRAYGQGGIILVHDSAFEEYSGDCALRFTDCTLYNYNSPYFFNVQCISPSNRVNLTFQNVAVHTVGYNATSLYFAKIIIQEKQ